MTTKTGVNNLRKQMADHKAYMEERQGKMLKVITDEYPELDVDSCELMLVDGRTLRLYLDNTCYLEVNGLHGFVLESPTQLGIGIEIAKKVTGGYQLVHFNSYAVALITPGYGDRIRVQEYTASKGSRCKGKRHYRTVHESTKGRYVELGGRRHYLTV